MNQSDPKPAADASTDASTAASTAAAAGVETTTPGGEPAAGAESASTVASTVAELCATWASFGLGVAGDALERFAAQQVRLGEALRKTSETLRKASARQDAEEDVPAQP